MTFIVTSNHVMFKSIDDGDDDYNNSAPVDCCIYVYFFFDLLALAFLFRFTISMPANTIGCLFIILHINIKNFLSSFSSVTVITILTKSPYVSRDHRPLQRERSLSGGAEGDNIVALTTALVCLLSVFSTQLRACQSHVAFR